MWLYQRKSGARYIQWRDGGKLLTIGLGRMPLKDARAFAVRFDKLLAAKISGLTVSEETVRWVANLPERWRTKLRSAGLLDSLVIEKLPTPPLVEFLSEYIAGRTDVKPNTLNEYRQTERNLTDYFKRNPPIDQITPHDCDSWVRWMHTKGLKPTTYGKRIKTARMFFKAAIRQGLLKDNPLADIKAPGQVNRSRDHFVSREVIDSVILSAPDYQWRLIISLARYGGLRCPSEVLALTWQDVKRDEGVLIVRSPKTARHESEGVRRVPIFPELRPYIDEAWELAADRTTHLITRYRDPSSNLRTQFLRIIKKAGQDPWPKLFQNLRASRETELVATFPLHVAAHFLGNSATIAQRHYLQITQDDYKRAIGARTDSAILGMIEGDRDSVGNDTTR